MKGDFTRDTFDPTHHYSRVLMQQGRVTLDADPNEQTAILLHYIRTLARDLIGPYAAPVEEGGFALKKDDKTGDLIITQGRYYVDGIMLENDADCSYFQQPDYFLPLPKPGDKTGGKPEGAFWCYLDVWERHITFIEDDHIREKALNGPDTCTRAKVIWQVRLLPHDGPDPAGLTKCDTPLSLLIAISDARLAARVDPGKKSDTPCVTPPDSKYSGAENHFYRIEIHQGSDAATPTFKWSRDNGSIVTAWLANSGTDLQVSSSRGFLAGDWVELSDDAQELQRLPGKLVKLVKVEGDLLTVDKDTVPADIEWNSNLLNPKVRRWNQIENEKVALVNGAVPITESSGSDLDDSAWIDLEDGVQVQFRKGGKYRSGDYWQVPARVATGNVEWPVENDKQIFMPPDGIEHHYAPLGFVSFAQGSAQRITPCRCVFDPLSSCFQQGSGAVGAHLIRPADFAERVSAQESLAVARQVDVRKKRERSR